MTSQTFPAGTTARVIITQIDGDLSVYAWDGQGIKVESDGRIAEINQHMTERNGDALVVANCDDDLELFVPAHTTLIATNVSGSAGVKGILRVEMHNVGGDVELEDIGESIELTGIGAELEVTHAPKLLSRGGIGSDVTLNDVGLVEIESVGADMTVQDAETVIISVVGADLEVNGVSAALRCGTVGAGCQVRGSADAEITLGNIGADLELSGAAVVQVGNVGADCELRDVQGNVEIGYVGAGIRGVNIGGNLQLGGVGADAELMGLGGAVESGSIGGDLELQSAFPPDSFTRLNVGGDASIVLPGNPNLSIRATVGGEVKGKAVVSGSRGNRVSLIYGDGAAQLELNVGGDLELSGKGSPSSSSSSSSSSWNEFGAEMANLGREMGRLGQDLGREIAAAFSEAGWSQGSEMADDIARRVEERTRRAQRRAEDQGRRAGERARRAGERAARVNIRFNEREWSLDPERLERIKEQARRATAEGIGGALEAVERAMSKMRMPVPPRPPAPPAPPTSPVGVPPMPGVPPVEKTQDEQRDGEKEAPAAPAEPDLEQERAAILSMIAEGRITPEEGDLLLEALGS